MPVPSIAFQGQPGAYSHLACRQAMPDHEPLPCESFEDAFEAVALGRAAFGMIPIENSLAGRVADVHHLLPETDLHIVAEHFQPVRHCLLAPKGASKAGIRAVHSHVHALGQCRRYLRENKLAPHVHADTAGAAADVARKGDPTEAAIASSLAAEIYGLEVIESAIEDAHHNTTRFVVLAKEPADPDPESGPVMTSFVFQVRNVPAALFKALGGFATNRVNMVKLESYMLDGSFSATQFYADIEGHPDNPGVRMAFEELGFFSRRVKVLGVYPANPFRYG
jgi:prephenate dehydratase